MANKSRERRVLLELGAQVAEIDALLACALTATSAQAEGRMFAQLASASARLQEPAEVAAGDRRPVRRAPAGTRERTRVQRRSMRARHTADRIIMRVQGGPRT